MNENEYKELNAVHLETVKELSRIVREQAKLLEQRNDTCCKYICISVIAVALLTVIALCFIFGPSNKCEGTLKIEGFPSTINILKGE